MGTIYQAWVESRSVHAVRAQDAELWKLEAFFYLPKEYDIAIAFAEAVRNRTKTAPWVKPAVFRLDGVPYEGKIFEYQRAAITLDEALAALRAQERERAIERVEDPSYGINGRAFIRWLREMAWHDWMGDAERVPTQWRIWLFADQ